MPRASREVLSVGIDVGTTTTQVVFSQLSLQDVARPGQVPRIQVDERSVVFRSDVHRTPLRSPDEVDAAALADLVARDYALAGIDRSAIETGAVIITGETARTSNADAILTALSATAGDFVVTVAGPNAEAQIAGRGSGVARWSADHYSQVTTIDVGGGTSNAAVFSNGRHLSSAALAVGGRLIELDPAGRVVRIAPPGAALIAHLHLGIRHGETASLADLQKFCDAMADLLADLATGREVTVGPGIAITPPLAHTENSTTVFFTGGVGACYYDQAPYAALADIAAYGDVGPLLAAAMRDNARIARLAVRRPPETIRATVLGAAAQTVTLSGSTIWADRDLLPLRNVPVVHPNREGSSTLTQSIDAALARWDLAPDAVAAIVIDMPTGIGYEHVTAVARDLVAHHARGGGSHLPLVLVMAQDYAQVLGQTIHSLAPGIPLLVIDQVGLGEGDYIDIGLPMLDGRAVPLSIKTLVFYD